MCRRAMPMLICGALLAACQQPASDPEPPAASAPRAETAEARPAAAQVPRRPAPQGARVYFMAPSDGASVRNPVRVIFGLQGAGIAPAGVDLPNTGHHHLLIDTEVTSFDVPLPADAQHVHFGAGQTETELTLAPGQHRLQLVLGDYLHVPHDPPLVSEPITIEVVE